MPNFDAPSKAKNKLTRLILEAVPENKFGRKTLTHAAEQLGVSNWGLRKWINAKKIPPERALQLVKLSKGKLNKNDFDDFVYKK